MGLWKRLTQVRVGPVELRLTGGRDKSIPLPEQTPYSAGQWRTFLRARNVVTLLAVAGLMLSIAALLVLVGIGETQIVASESPGRHTAHLFTNGWFDGGLVFAVAGILVGIVAISASSSQASALREFPDLTIRVIAKATFDTSEPGAAPFGGRSVRLYYVRVRVFNRERERNASLSLTLLWDTLPEAFTRTERWSNITALGFPPVRWKPDALDGLPAIEQMPPILHVDPKTIGEGDIFFEIPSDQIEKLDQNTSPRIELVEHNSGQWITVPTASGEVYGGIGV